MGDEVLCIGLLGAFSISAGDSVIADDAWRLRKAKTLIKLLALAPERRLHVEQAAELLWAGRDPDSARNNLHQAIFAARRALDSIGLDGSRYLELREELILLSPEDPVRIDAVAFEELAAAAREQGEPGAYRSALEGFDAELLPADRYEDWSRERRDSLDQLRLALEAELAELERDSEPHLAACQPARAAVTADQLRRPRARAGRGRGAAARREAPHPDRSRRLRQDQAGAAARRAAGGGLRRRGLAGRAGGARRARAGRPGDRPGAGHAAGLRPGAGDRPRRAHRRSPAAAPARQLRAPGRAGRAPRRGSAQPLPEPDRAGDQPRAAPHSRRGDLARPLALPPQAGPRSARGGVAGGGVGAAVRHPGRAGRARIRARRRQRGRRRLPLPPPRRDAAGDRAGGGAGERPDSGSDRRAPRRLARPALGRAPHGDDPAADPAGDARLELRAARGRRAGAAASARRVCRRLRAGGG